MSKANKARERVMDKRRAEIARQREPGPREKKAIERAEQRLRERPAYPNVKTVVTAGVAAMGPVHNDNDGFTSHLFDTCGSGSSDFTSAMIQRIEFATRPRGTAATMGDDQVNAMLALMTGIAPKDEFEAVIAEQIITAHLLSMELMGKARHADMLDKLQVYTNAATKLSRTMVAQTEALARLRTGGKQQVIVKHVYVNGNAIVADNAQTVVQGGGGTDRSGGQSHAALALADGPGAALLCEDPFGRGVPIAGGQGSEAVQDARRDEPRRAKWQSQRTL